MCILFIYNGANIKSSDYSLILTSNRDEAYDRLTKNLAPWDEDANVYGGRDLEDNGGGTWLAISAINKRIGVLLNLPGKFLLKAKTRGKIVADYVKSGKPTSDYVHEIKSYAKETNEFVFVTIELSTMPRIFTYNNVSDTLDAWSDTCIGFSNSLPDCPLKKVKAGIDQIKEICETYSNIDMKASLVQKLLNVLKSREKHLPDSVLENGRPKDFSLFSSIFVSVPEKRYGTRTHTVILISKTGDIDMIEETLKAPIDPENPVWERTTQKLVCK